MPTYNEPKHLSSDEQVLLEADHPERGKMFDSTTELPEVIVHTGERQSLRFNPETHGISQVITTPEGLKICYVAPLTEVPWLSRLTGENGAPVTSEEESIELSKS